ncbi:pyridine nucleotide-disulfide oxidoreductase [Chitinophagaceae bacterium IBVUCB2]|nr:pyridine nucleotide-disulfide oxidoreductase [Chitinophagaceae bacterium IBVUCB2]
METATTYDVAIVGGGLAGLSLSIQLKRQGYSVILFEKEQYPFHKICGEYISLESWDFLNDLGVDLDSMKVPIITKLQVSSVSGKMLEHSLPLGGFGISRYRLDNTLVQIAKTQGVDILENTKVNDVTFSGDEFSIHTSLKKYQSKLVAGSYGKRSNIDIKWKRSFISAAKNKLNNYIGVKYHVKSAFPVDTIALHNFKNGYCGIVKIEDDNYNICYMTTASNLQKSNGNIKQMEAMILSQNPHLKKIFTESNVTLVTPLTISQISFDKKSQVENHVLMVGDAAGMITPLCGNGMSMALHGSKIAATLMQNFLKHTITRDEMEKQYSRQWSNVFAHRLVMGRRIQRLFGRNWLTNLFITIAKPFPGFVSYLVRQTHGNPF